MLANSHTGLVNAENAGSQDKLWSYVDKDDDDHGEGKEEEKHPALRNRSRIPPSTGAYSHLHGLSFIAIQDLEPGHEVFVEYGDNVCIISSRQWLCIVSLSCARSLL